MGMKKIKKEIARIEDKAFNDGYDAGFNAALNSEALKNEIFEEGIQAERKRVVALFRMLSENELEHGTGTKAKFWKEAGDLVKIADELEIFDEEGNLIDNEY